MKKMIFIFTLLATMFCSLNVSAQTKEQAIKQSKLTDNVFVKGNVGGSWSLLNSDSKFWENVNPMATVSVGRYLTPTTGFQVSVEGGFNEGGKCFVDHTNLTLDGLLNFSNLLGGYVGQPRVFEVVGVLGAGWFHTYGDISNSASAKAAVELNFNLGKSKAWQINVIPSWTYLPPNAIDNSYAAVSVGMTYKFKNSNDTHNFMLVDIRDQKEIDELNSKINDLREDKAQLVKMNEKNTCVIQEQVKAIEELTKCCVKARETKEVVALTNAVQFEIGKSEVDKLQMANVAQIAEVLKTHKDLKIEIKGFADAKTGTCEINQKLSESRAESVKTALVETFGIDCDRITTVGVGSSEQVFSENDLNRVTIFVSKQ